MFGMSMTEIVFILAAGLVILGPEKIPDVAKTLGKVLREVRKASNLLRDTMLLEEPDTSKKRTPAVSQAPVETPNTFDQMDAPEPMDMSTLDPSPDRNLEVVRMRARTQPEATAIREVAMEVAEAELVHREVYLHIPYEETI